MNKFKLTSAVLYLFVAVMTAGMGITFITAVEYFPYHQQISGIDWPQVQPGLKFVYLAVFKVCGAGAITVSLSMFLMIIFPFIKYDHRWSFYAIPTCGLVFWSITLATTLYVYITTDAATPWIASLSCVGATILAFIISLFCLEKAV
jgi:hypothetical protein